MTGTKKFNASENYLTAHCISVLLFDSTICLDSEKYYFQIQKFRLIRMALSKAQRLTVVICISTSFFLAELSIGFYTKSLALIADAFHYLNDLIGFMVALAALRVSQRSDSPDFLSFGWQRAELLGAFFNGCFLLALGVSIALQSIDRFVYLESTNLPALGLSKLNIFFCRSQES